MTFIANIINKTPHYVESKIEKIKSTEYYQKLMDMPPLKRWAIVAGLFLLSQLVVFGSLYLIFGKIVVIGDPYDCLR